MSDLTQRIATLSPEKQALLLKRLNRQAPASAPPQRIAQRPAGPAPLSFAQQRLWFMYQLEPSSPLYNTPISVRLRGELDVATMERSLNEIIRRHEVLRTTFATIDGKASQVVAPTMTIHLPVLDLSMRSETERMTEALRLVTVESRRLFDLAEGPLVRMSLVRLSEQEYILLATAHHIISDAWTMHVLMKELTTLYDAYSRNLPSPLPDLPIQYADFAYWQREWLQGDVLEAQVAYWKQKLSGDLPVLDLPTIGPRPAVLSHHGARYGFTLPSEAISNLCRQEQVTPFMVWLALVSTLLYRYTGQDDILIGAPIANRTRTEMEGLIGFFSNTLPLRVDLSGNPTFRESLKRVQESAVGAYAHQDIPFEKLIDVLQLERSLSGMPLIQVMMVFQNNWPDTMDLPGLHLEPLTIDNKTSEVDLSLVIEEHADEFFTMIEYSTELFDEATAIRMSGHLQTLLAASIANPDQHIAALPLLTDDERRQIVVEWNSARAQSAQTSKVDAAMRADEQLCIYQLFEAQAQRKPSAIAAIYEDENMSYDALHRASNRLAWSLVAAGIGPNTVVALLAERSITYLTALLAIHKAGGAFLPLDPQHPAQRFAEVLEQSASTLILTTSEFTPVLAEVRANMASEKQPRIFQIEDILRQSAADDNLPARCTVNDLAYVMFTSGSTGLPKGAMIEQKGMFNHIRAKIADLDLTEADRLAQTARQSFDIIVWQYLAPLVMGGQVVIFKDEIAYNPDLLIEHMCRAGVSILQLVPTLLQAVVQQLTDLGDARPDFPVLRWVVPTGDALATELCHKWFRFYPHIPLLNNYGATECSDDYCHYPIHHSAQLDDRAAIVTIGRPIPAMQTYVLDAQLQPVPIGVIGEIYAGGVAVGRGYLNDPARTAVTFLPNPFASQPGARLYKSGDQGRYQPDGTIAILGRVDYQVKIRGVRIELGEIEAMLRQHPAVREALVVVWADDTDHKYLVGYLVPAAEHSIDINELRGFLKEQLPENMIPLAFVLLDALPLTPNGKVDRKNLPAPDSIGMTSSTAYVAPRTPAETVLTDLWAQLLKQDRVGIHDNFFALGGDSILSIQVIARANQAGLRLTPKQLFQYQTIAELAAVAGDSAIDNEARQPGVDESDSRAARLRSGNGYTPADFPMVTLSQHQLDQLIANNDQLEDIYPLSAMQQYMLLQSIQQPPPGLYVIHANYLFIPGSVDVAMLQQAWQKIVDFHPVLRSSFAWEGLEQPVQLMHRQAHVLIEQHDWRGLSLAVQEEQLEALVQADRRRGYDLSHAPLIRIILAQIADGTYKYIFSNHHIIMDGWSRALIQKQAFDVYQASRRGEVFEIPASRPFRDFIDWQQQQNMSEAKQFWGEKLAGFTAPTPLPKKHTATRQLSREDGYVKHRIFLPAALYSALTQLARQQHLTLNVLVQGAWLLLLGRYSGQQDLVLGVTSSGRPVELSGIESVVGLCINMLPLRVQLAPEMPLPRWLKALHEQQVELRQYEYTPLHKIQEWSDLPPGVPLFECALVFENYPSNLRSIGENVDFNHPLGQKDYQMAQVELPLRVEAVPGAELLLVMCYYQSQFDDDTATQMLRNWQTMLETIVSQPEQALSAFLAD